MFFERESSSAQHIFLFIINMKLLSSVFPKMSDRQDSTNFSTKMLMLLCMKYVHVCTCCTLVFSRKKRKSGFCYQPCIVIVLLWSQSVHIRLVPLHSQNVIISLDESPRYIIFSEKFEVLGGISNQLFHEVKIKRFPKFNKHERRPPVVASAFILIIAYKVYNVC